MKLNIVNREETLVLLDNGLRGTVKRLSKFSNQTPWLNNNGKTADEFWNHSKVNRPWE
jgi:hypothetical protein